MTFKEERARPFPWRVKAFIVRRRIIFILPLASQP